MMVRSVSAFAVGATVVALVFLTATSLAQAADCPLSISSLRLAAKGAHGGSVLYRLQLTAIDAEDRRATIDIETAGSKTTSLDGVDIHPGSTSSGEAATFWFKRGSADVRAASIRSAAPRAGGDAVPCAERFVGASSGPDNGNTVVGVYDDRLSLDKFSLDIVASLETETDASFIDESRFLHKVQPDSPDLAGQGDVAVGITIGPDGKVLDSWIAWTSSDALLNEAALKAARESTYQPPTLNGRPTIRQYTIIYSFRNDQQDAPYGTADQAECAVHLFGLSIDHHDPTRGITWYAVKAWTKQLGAVSAGVTFQNANGEEGRVAWPHLDLRKSTSIQGYVDRGLFDWNGLPIVSAWISDFTNADGIRTICQPWTVNLLPMQTVSVETASAAAKGHTPQISIEKPLPASFAEEIWPEYTQSQMDASVEGTAGVQVLVDDKGAAREAHVMQSSGNTALDNAAVAAAMRSTYSVTPAVDIYTVYYKFGVE